MDGNTDNITKAASQEVDEASRPHRPVAEKDPAWLRRLPRWARLMWHAWQRMDRAKGGLLAAGVAFYGLLSVFPGMTAAVALFGMFADPTVITEQSAWLTRLLPPSAADLLNGQLVDVAMERPDRLGWAAILSISIAFWSASRAANSLMQGLNVIYNRAERRGMVMLYIRQLTITFAAIVGALFLVLVVAAIPAALALFGDSPLLSDIAQVVRWPLMFVSGMVGISLLYRFGPDRRGEEWHRITPGAFVSCSLWVAGSIGFSYYVRVFGSYSETFGTLSGVVLLLTWMWLSAFVVLYGAGIDAERPEHRA